MKAENPFVIKGYRGSEFFCDREKETRKLVAAIENGRDVTIMAPRRYGKTGLVRHVFHSLGKGYAPLYVDIFNITCLADFVKVFASAVLDELATPLERTGKGLVDFFRAVRPTITPQADGFPKFSFDLAPAQAEATLKDVFSFLESRKVEPVVAIDEFQQVREFPERGVEALLRSHVQFCHNAHFVFAGSKRHMMEEMFALPRGPFYQSTQILPLDVIPCEKYRAFAQAHFRRGGRKFDGAVFDRLYERFDGITWYVQVLLNRIWERPQGLDSVAAIDETVETFVEENALTYHDLLASQTDAARRVLKAIASEGVAKEISGKAFCERHDLPAGSTVRSTLADLVSRDLVDRGEDGCRVYDRFFAQWLRNESRAATA